MEKNIKIIRIEKDRYGNISKFSFIFFMLDGVEKSILLKNFLSRYGMFADVQMFLMPKRDKNGILKISANQKYVYSMM